jgi:SagB-type dehydrogenase family enzyme
MAGWTWTVGVLVSSLSLVACQGSTMGPSKTPSPAASGAIVELPPPRTDGEVSLERALQERRSVRSFTREGLTPEELGQLLWAGQGITADWGGRTAPSAGALYPLEVYAALPDALYRYLPEGHRAQVVSAIDVRGALAVAALGQEAVAGAAAVLVIAAVPARTEAKYGNRAERYVHLEAGHAAQNVLLQAVALGLTAVPVGAFSDEDVARVLGLDRGEVPLYLIPVGHPAEDAS